MSTYSIPVSGPSPRMAMLNALIRKMATTGQTAWAHACTIIGATARHSRGIAHTALTVIGSPAGYHLALTGVRTLITTTWDALRRTVHWVSSTAGTVADRGVRLIGMLSPALARALTAGTHVITAPLTAIMRTTSTWVETTGHLLWLLATTNLVRTCTTRAAVTAITLSTVHALTHGALAASIVRRLPWTLDAIITITNPARALMFVLGTTIVAMAVAAARLARGITPLPPAAEQRAATQQQEAEAAAEDEVLTDLITIAAHVSVEVLTDGSIVVTGIPDSVPADLGQVIAEIATQGALRQLRRTLPIRPTPSRDDRRLFTKAAREAIRAEATRRLNNAA